MTRFTAMPNDGSTLAPSHRIILLVAAVLSTIAGIQLFVLSGDTARFFAWTVTPPIAASFFGAGFIALAGAAFLGLRVGESRQIVPFLVVAVVATIAILAASLIHLDRFHLSSSDPLPLLAAWLWLGVYVVVPIVLVGLMLGSGARPRTPVHDPSRRPIPPLIRAGLAGLVIASVILAVVAFVAPASLRWPYPLTPLTARMTGAFLASIATAMIVILLVDNLDRLRVAPITLVLFGAGALYTLARYAGDVSTAGAGIWIYLGLFGAMLVLGGALMYLVSRAPTRVARPVVGRS